jgi:hypothetical protein
MDHLAWLSTYVRLQARDEWAERGNDRRVAQELNHSLVKRYAHLPGDICEQR